AAGAGGMTSLALRLARPEIVALEPFDIAACNGNAAPDAIKLDANENPYPPLVEGSLAASVNRYPEPQPQHLKASLSALYGVAVEAYLDFSQTPSLASEATKRANLVVLKTLSKAYGLAGARVGCAIGVPELIAVAARALPPYPMPSPSVDAALAALAPSRRAI